MGDEPRAHGAVSTLTDTYEAASAAALGHEVRYVRCRCSGFGARSATRWHPPFFTRDRNGGMVPAVSRIGGEFAAGYTGRLWLPEGISQTRELRAAS